MFRQRKGSVSWIWLNKGLRSAALGRDLPPLLAGRTPAIDHTDHRGPPARRDSQLGRLRNRRGSRAPCTAAVREFVILAPPGMTAGRRMFIVASQGSFLPLTFTFTSRAVTLNGGLTDTSSSGPLLLLPVDVVQSVK